MFKEIIVSALSALKANKIRSLLTTLGIIIGVFAVISLVSLVSGLKKDIKDQILGLGGDVLTISPGNIEEGGFGGGGGMGAMMKSFGMEDVRAIKEAKIPEVKEVNYQYETYARIEYGEKSYNTLTLGCEPALFKIFDNKILIGRLFDSKEDQSGGRVAVLGKGMAAKIFGSADRALDKEIKVEGKSFKIIGILDETDMNFGPVDVNDVVYIPAESAKKYLELSRISEIHLKLISDQDILTAKRKVEKVLKESRGMNDFTVLTPDSMTSLIDDIMGMLTTALAGISAISLLVGGIGIMNIMLVSVTERTKEIGIRKALGATDANILTQFLAEAVVLCILGGFLGLGLSALLSFILNQFTEVPSHIEPATILLAIAFSASVGLIFGTAPALKAAKKDPIEALRYE